MTLLAFDCSLRRFTALLLDHGGAERAGIAHGPDAWRGEEIVALLDRLCRGCGLAWTDLEALAVTVGPGSFTGIRTAVAAARGLALAADLPVFPVGTLEALARDLPASEGRPVAAVLRGKRGQLYLQCFAADGIALAPPAALPAAALPAHLPREALVVTPEPAMLEDLLGRREIRAALPDARAVAAIARRRREGGERGVAGHLVEPLYLRAADANPLAGRPLVAPVE